MSILGMDPRHQATIDFAYREGFNSLSEDEQNQVRRISRTKGIEPNLALSLFGSNNHNYNRTIQNIEDRFDELSRRTNIYVMEHLHKLFVMAAGSVRWACSTFKSRVKKVMTEAKCDTTEARNSLFESNFDCNFAIRTVRDRNIKILLDQDFHARGELNVDSATELLERHGWDIRLAGIEYNSPETIKEFQHAILRRHNTHVVDPSSILDRVDWKVNDAVELWESEEMCSICGNAYDGHNVHKETEFCECGQHMCLNCEGAMMVRGQHACPFCNRPMNFDHE